MHTYRAVGDNRFVAFLQIRSDLENNKEKQDLYLIHTKTVQSNNGDPIIVLLSTVVLVVQIWYNLSNITRMI